MKLAVPKGFFLLFWVAGICLLPACLHHPQKAKSSQTPPAPAAVAPSPFTASPAQPSQTPSSSFIRVHTKTGTDIYVITRGVGYPDVSLSPKQVLQRNEKSQRDALVEAQTKMLFILSDFMMKSGMTVGRKMETDNDFTTKVNNAVNAAEVTDTSYTKDGACTVTIRLQKKAFEKAIGAEVSR